MDNYLYRSPLIWPEGWDVTPLERRRPARYRADFKTALVNVSGQLRRMRANDITINTDVPHDLRNGQPRFGVANGFSGGAAVFFRRQGRQHVMASDTWRTVAHNLQAVAKALDAMRAIERCGASNILDRAFVGLRALPPHLDQGRWTEVLQLDRNVTEDVIKRTYRELAVKYHPDRAGSHDAMVAITTAYEQAIQEVRRRIRCAL